MIKHSFIHGNTGKIYEREKFRLLKENIIKIFQNTKFDGINFNGISYSYFNQILAENYNIKVSESYIKKILKTNCHYISPRSSKCKSKLFHLMRSRKEKEGELIQVDGSEMDIKNVFMVLLMMLLEILFLYI